jgi:hypothetical protein
MKHWRSSRLPGKMQGTSAGGIVKPAGKTFAPGGVGFCDNTFCELIDDAKATAKQTTITAKNIRAFMLCSSPVALLH